MGSKIDWNEKELVNWIGTNERPLRANSRKIYKRAFTAYHEFTELTAKELIDEAEQDDSLPKRKRGQPKRRILAFAEWLKASYISPRERKKEDPERGISPKSMLTYFGAVRGFYRDNNFKIEFSRGEAPTATVTTEREMMRREDVKKLLNKALEHRDKAIIMCLYQSGMDISTLLSLNYGHVKKGLERGDEILLVKATRIKTNTRYRTCFGKDAVVHLKNYLRERGQMKVKEPLFMTTKLFTYKNGTSTKPERVKSNTVIGIFRQLVVRAGLISEEELEAQTINPYGTHALRASFSKIATAVGMNKNLIDYLQGHKTPYHGVYSDLTDEMLIKAYRDLEPHLNVSELIVSELDQLKAHARTVWGIDLEKVIADKAQEIANSGLGGGKMFKGTPPNLEDPTVVAELLRNEIKQQITPNNFSKPELTQKIIHQDELEAYMAQGWLFKAALNNGTGKVIVEKGV